MKLKNLKQKMSGVVALFLTAATVLSSTGMTVMADEIGDAENKVITGFGKTEYSVSIDEKVSLAELEKKLPDKVDATLAGDGKETITAKWTCTDDYEATEYETYTFEFQVPDGYELSSELTAWDVPYVEVKITSKENQNTRMQFPQNGDTGIKLDKALGCTSDVTTWLKKHETDGYYLGTPHDTSIEENLSVAQCEANSTSPYGDVRGSDAGMNCTGFVAHALEKCGADLSIVRKNNSYQGRGGYANASNWHFYAHDNSITSYRYDSIQAMLNSGILKKGDVIYFEPSDEVWINGQDKYGNPADCHIGFFWGDSPTDNKFWHSDHYGNRISEIVPKCDDCAVYVFPVVHEGRIKVKKVSSNPTITDGNSCYSLEGAIFGVYDAQNNRVAELVTNSKGETNVSADLPTGKYTLREEKAPQGYAKVPDQPINVVGGQTTVVEIKEIPQNDPINIALGKIDVETTKNLPQGDSSLKDAHYEIKYYGGFHDTDPALDGMKPIRSWVLKTNDKGITYLSDKNLVSGDELFVNSTGAPCLPLGTVTVQEVKAPEGYELNDELFIRKITSEGDAEAVHTFNIPSAPEQVYRGGVQIQKWDKELDKSEAIGGKDHGDNEEGTTLAGIEFTIYNKSENAVEVDGTLYDVDAAVATIKTHWNTEKKAYTAETAADTLPYGTYEIKETKTNDSYLLTDGKARSFEIREDGVVVTADIEKNELVFKNQVVRGDFKLTKVANSTMKRLSVPFKVTNLTTGETHVIVTDKNGEYSSGSDWNKHSEKTNANDKLLKMDEIKAKDMDASAGIWFGLGEDGSEAKVKDKLSALPYGAYEMEELPCENNKGYGMQKFNFYIYKDSTIVDLSTVTDDSEPEIKTTAKDENGDQVVLPTDKVTIYDTVKYNNLRPMEEYEVHGKLYEKIVKEDGTVEEKLLLDKNGNEITASKKFTPKSEFGEVVVEFTFDASLMEGKTTVVFEELYKDGKLIVAHSDINDKDQTIEFEKPEIHTTAMDKADEDKKVLAKEDVTILDKVAYDKLVPGKKYELQGVLMEKIVDPETEEVAEQPLLDKDGKEIRVSKVFTPKESKGTVEVEFTLDASLMAGKTTVVFETLYREDKEIAVHADINDKGQTVEFVHNTKLDIEKNDFVTGKPVEGATLQIIDKDGNVVAEWVTGKEPYHIEGIAPGDYILRETIAPEGYIRTEEVKFTLEDNGEIQKVEMLDDYTKLKISKKDIADSEEIPGAKMQILDKVGNVVEEWTSEKEPHYIEKLPVGDYTLKEVTAPKGYVKAEQVPFKVEETGEIQNVEMKDARVEGYIVVEKVSSVLRTPIQGVEFTLTDEKGKVIGTYTTDSNGLLKTTTLPIGTYEKGEYKGPLTYYIQETKCPSDYVIDKTKYKVVFEYLNDETPLVYQKLTVPNKKKDGEDIPKKTVARTSSKKTGDLALWQICVVLAAIGCTGIVGVLVYRKKTKK